MLIGNPAGDLDPEIPVGKRSSAKTDALRICIWEHERKSESNPNRNILARVTRSSCFQINIQTQLEFLVLHYPLPLKFLTSILYALLLHSMNNNNNSKIKYQDRKVRVTESYIYWILKSSGKWVRTLNKNWNHPRSANSINVWLNFQQRECRSKRNVKNSENLESVQINLQ